MREHYKGYRYPKSIVGFAVRYYHRYKLSYRDISEILFDRGIEVALVLKWRNLNRML